MFCIKASKTYRARVMTETDNTVSCSFRLGMNALLRAEKETAEECVHRLYKDSPNYLFIEEKGIVLVVGRKGVNQPSRKLLGLQLETSYEDANYCVPVLSQKGALARAVTEDAHSLLHCKSPGYTAAILQRDYFIPYATSLAKQVQKDCFTCKRLSAKPEVVEMAALPGHRREGNPGEHLAIDLLGPYHVLEHLGRETRSGAHRSRSSKLYFLIGVDSFTRMCFLTPCQSLSTQDVLIALDSLTCLTGKPVSITSDSGSQLAQMAREGVADREEDPQEEPDEEGLDDKQLQEVQTALANKQIAFTTHLGKCPWRNGSCESIVRVLRQCLRESITKRTRITATELTHVMTQACTLVNSRPICALPLASTDAREVQTLSPLQLNPGHHTGLITGGLGHHSAFTDRQRVALDHLTRFKQSHAVHYLKVDETIGP